MSIKLMSAAWDLDIPSTEKMVLMCLCDFANDEGIHCWPSVATIARKCSKGERTIQAALKSLNALGYLTIHERAGTSSQYHLNPRKICTPAKSAPPQKTADTPAKSAPKPPRTTKQPKDARPHELPDGWMPAEFGSRTKSRAVVDGWPPGEIETQLEHFTAHHRGRGNKFKDWQDAWSTWVLGSRNFNRIQRNDRQSPRNDELQNPYVRVAARRQAERAAAVR